MPKPLAFIISTSTRSWAHNTTDDQRTRPSVAGGRGGWNGMGMRRGRKKKRVKGLAGTGEQTQSCSLLYAFSLPSSSASACGPVGPGDQKPPTPTHLPTSQPLTELSQL